MPNYTKKKHQCAASSPHSAMGVGCNGVTRTKRGMCRGDKNKTFKSSANVAAKSKSVQRTSVKNKNDQEIFHTQIMDLCNANGIQITHDNTLMGSAIGIGDILLKILSIKFKLTQHPMYVNVCWFMNTYNRINPINQLEFRIKLIRELCESNNIPNNMVKFIYTKNPVARTFTKKDYESMNNFKLEFNSIKPLNDDRAIDGEYIVFHTKCRHQFKLENYELLKQKLSEFCSNYKSNCKIVILGERNFPHTGEVDMHGITEVYNELMNLTKNNEVIDLSIDCIYSNLNYESYKKDIAIIMRAKHNISFGLGGALCTSMCFGSSTIFYCKNTIMKFDKENLIKNDIHHFGKVEDCFNYIAKLAPMPDSIVVPIIYPTLGLGDILLLKMRSVIHNLDIKKIVICKELIQRARNNVDKNIKLRLDLFNLLFKNTIVEVDDQLHCWNNDLTSQYPITKIHCIFDTLGINVNIPYENYIIFHTKIRFIRRYMNDDFVQDLNAFVQFFKNFKTDKTIIILGERNVPSIIETTRFGVRTIYDELLLLKNNNNVLDLTHDSLYDGQIDFNGFLYECQLINSADCNITFSIGGHYCLAISMAKKCINYMPTQFLNYVHEQDYLRKEVNALCNDSSYSYPTRESFLNKIDSDYSIKP